MLVRGSPAILRRDSIRLDSMRASNACIERSTHYEWMRSDHDYAAKVDQALEDAVDLLEAVTRKRAVVGSEVLLIFLLEGVRPERYRERHQVKHEGDSERMPKG